MAADGQARFQSFHKDFYLNHPSAELQTEEYCFGNVQAHHPVLGRRSQDEVDRYRYEQGLTVDYRGDREAPKPVQQFSEVSFPNFVMEIVHMMLPEGAVPFPVQAQAWPSALSGMDVLAVAPTGSGKTLAYLLPALVHVMAQRELSVGEGPIVLVLVHTPELAQQTHEILQRFCACTHGRDLLRAGVVHGGVDMSVQLPEEFAPDYLRWPELLVATPRRLLELMGKHSLNLHRCTYMVVDEADLLLSCRGWKDLVHRVIEAAHPERQLLFLCATWHAEADKAIEKFCHGELVRLRQRPSVPSIPQDVRLFEGRDEQASRRYAVSEWLQNELGPHEGVVLFCNNASSIKFLQEFDAVLQKLKSLGFALLSEARSEEERLAAYQGFIRGETRVLITTFGIGARGLDYRDSTSSASGSVARSVVVVLFDFPPNIREYVNCIGRTLRPGQGAGGRAVVFIPEWRFWIARELREVLEACMQPVPQALAALVATDSAFLEVCQEGMERLRKGDEPWIQGKLSGDFDEEKGLWALPANLPSYRRRLLHQLAEEEDLPHVSTGRPPSRRLHVARTREALPDKFFVMGEEVLVQPRDKAARHARVVDPKILPLRRTIRVCFDDDGTEEVAHVDDTTLCSA